MKTTDHTNFVATAGCELQQFLEIRYVRCSWYGFNVFTGHYNDFWSIFTFFYFFPRNLLLVQNITPLQISTTRRQSGHCLWQRVSLAEHEILQIQCGREQERERERERGTTTDKKECEMILVQLWYILKKGRVFVQIKLFFRGFQNQNKLPYSKLILHDSSYEYIVTTLFLKSFFVLWSVFTSSL